MTLIYGATGPTICSQETTSTIAIYYYSAKRLILILPYHKRWLQTKNTAIFNVWNILHLYHRKLLSLNSVFLLQTLFNPNKTVVKMFVVVYDLSDMPPNSQTFLRQRTLYMPVKGSPSDSPNFMVYLRYLIHLRLVSCYASYCIYCY